MEKLKKKNKNSAQGDAFACQLFYFLMKALVLYMLYIYNNPLKENLLYAISYIALLILNSYLIVTTGNHPGFAPIQHEQQQTLADGCLTNIKICQICYCKKKLRMKHCFQCGRCVYKFDHHCPWIGACVGQFNHSNFWFMSLFQTIQSWFSLSLFWNALGNYSYSNTNNYGKQYGAIFIFFIFMILYFLFVSGLLLFHSYLILVNFTSYQMNKSYKLQYLAGGKSNPFDYGPIENIKLVFCHDKIDGIQWKINEKIKESEQVQLQS